MPSVTVVSDEIFALHDLPGAPESQRRLDAVVSYLDTHPMLAALPREHAPEGVDDGLLLAVHRDSHLRSVAAMAGSGGGWIDGDTYCTARSDLVARRAVAAAVRATELVGSGASRSAFALIRPPGHHATPHRAMGFCLYNSVAVAAAAARRRFGYQRVAIIDIDVHHGNGTQDIFAADPAVLYCSLHQFPLYPGTGRAGETGEGRGVGTTVNVPLAPGTDGAAWLEAFELHVAPAIARQHPELILVSAGYDAHRADPLASLRLETETFAAVTARIVELAAEHAGGRTAWVLEGGYDLDALAASVATTLVGLGSATAAE